MDGWIDGSIVCVFFESPGVGYQLQLCYLLTLWLIANYLNLFLQMYVIIALHRVWGVK